MLLLSFKLSTRSGKIQEISNSSTINFSLTASFLVVVGFWASAGINSTLENDYGTQTWSFSPKNPPLMVQNFHGHIMVAVAMILELIWNRTPVNLYHVIFLWIFGSAYGLGKH